LPKAPTGIQGLDEITGGGLPRGRPTLVSGSAGCGKTLLAMEFLARGATEFGEPGVFMSFEENAAELTTNFRSLGHDLDALVARKQLALEFVYIERSEIEETGDYDLEGLFLRLGAAIDGIGARRVVLDTIEALFSGLSIGHMFAVFGYGIDVQTGVPRAWSAIATAAFALGSLVLYDDISLSWVTLLVAIVGMALAMVGGMPAMVRTRFSTPTIGREWMVGEVGSAVGAVAPEGVVSVRDAPWRARTNRATPIEAGQSVRVVSIDGLLLEVEPLEGAARDHRDR